MKDCKHPKPHPLRIGVQRVPIFCGRLTQRISLHASQTWSRRLFIAISVIVGLLLDRGILSAIELDPRSNESATNVSAHALEMTGQPTVKSCRADLRSTGKQASLAPSGRDDSPEIRKEVGGQVKFVEFLSPQQAAETQVEEFGAGEAEKAWLDIRPRTLATADEPSVLVATEDVPPHRLSSSTAKEMKICLESPVRTDLSLSDFCEASRFQHGPLYFENKKMERQGVSGKPTCPPFLAASGDFVWRLASTPWLVCKQPPGSSVLSGCLEK